MWWPFPKALNHCPLHTCKGWSSPLVCLSLTLLRHKNHQISWFRHLSMTRLSNVWKRGLVLLQIINTDQDHYKYCPLCWPRLSTTPAVDHVFTLFVCLEWDIWGFFVDLCCEHAIALSWPYGLAISWLMCFLLVHSYNSGKYVKIVCGLCILTLSTHRSTAHGCVL